MAQTTLTPEQQDALRTIHLITQIGGTEGYLQSLAPIEATHNTSAIDAKFNPPAPSPTPVQIEITPNNPFPGHYTLTLQTIPEFPIGGTTWHASGISYAPGAVAVTATKGWNLFLDGPWTLDKLITAHGLRYKFRTSSDLPGVLLCDIISGGLLVGSFGGPLEEQEIKALNSTGGAIHWFATFPYPPFHRP